MSNSTVSASSGELLGVLGSSSWTATLLVALVSYAILCSCLRFRRLNQIRSRFKFPDRASLSRMTSAEAHAIIYNMSAYEFPTFVQLGLQYGVFRSFTPDSTAKLLFATGNFARADDAPKRFEDTAAIFASFVVFLPSSPQLHKAVARMNYLHAPYIKSGKIPSRDVLYTLYSSMTDPVHVIREYDWRPLTELEVAAQGTLWKYIGDMMGIDYAELLGRNEWKDGIDFMEDVTQWAHKHVDPFLQPTPEAHRLGTVLVDMMLSSCPKMVRPLGKKIISVAVGERMRYLYSFPEPGLAASALTFTLLLLRKLFVRHLSLPRFTAVAVITDPDPKTGRIHANRYVQEPWYNRVTIWARWGPAALLTRVAGGMVPGDGGPEMKPEGFLWEDLGPRHTVGRGVDETARMEEQVREIAARKYPFAASTKSESGCSDAAIQPTGVL